MDSSENQKITTLLEKIKRSYEAQIDNQKNEIASLKKVKKIKMRN